MSKAFLGGLANLFVLFLLKYFAFFVLLSVLCQRCRGYEFYFHHKEHVSYKIWKTKKKFSSKNDFDDRITFLLLLKYGSCCCSFFFLLILLWDLNGFKSYWIVYRNSFKKTKKYNNSIFICNGTSFKFFFAFLHSDEWTNTFYNCIFYWMNILNLFHKPLEEAWLSININMITIFSDVIGNINMSKIKSEV